MINVGVIGAAGRMGRTVLDAVDAADDMELVVVVDPNAAALDLPENIATATSVDEVADGAADVLVDFTSPDVANAHLADVLARGFHLVVGTSGISEEVVAELANASAGGANCVIAPNFAIGAVLMQRFAAQAAPYFDAVEVIELHHDKKVDAPSGTAMATAAAISRARHEAKKRLPADPTTIEHAAGARGARVDDVPVHSVRLPGHVAHQEVLFGNAGETLTVRHDSIDRISFMPGVLVAIRKVASMPGVTVGLEHLLED
jgi:4-hydroxy-tetrahydrodipicolinate reductase